MYSLASSSADTKPQVRFILLCSSDSPCNDGENVRELGSRVNAWYYGRVGKTFLQGQSEVYKSSHPSSYFHDTGPQVIKKVSSELHSKDYFASNTKIVVVTNFPVFQDDVCGVAYIGGSLAISDPKKHKSCQRDNEGTVIHELGHMFGLDHIDDGTVMSPVIGCKNTPINDCNINTLQSELLKDNQYMVISQGGSGKNNQPVVQPTGPTTQPGLFRK